MKDHVEIGHLTKYDAFRLSREQVMDLEILFNIPVMSYSKTYRRSNGVDMDVF